MPTIFTVLFTIKTSVPFDTSVDVTDARIATALGATGAGPSPEFRLKEFNKIFDGDAPLRLSPAPLICPP
jgi:hypothetical protein